jgi:hypothetical protein
LLDEARRGGDHLQGPETGQKRGGKLVCRELILVHQREQLGQAQLCVTEEHDKLVLFHPLGQHGQLLQPADHVDKDHGGVVFGLEKPVQGLSAMVKIIEIFKNKKKLKLQTKIIVK